MANQLSKKKQRLSYAEEVKVAEELRAIAKEKGVPLSDVLKEANQEYLASKKRI